MYHFNKISSAILLIFLAKPVFSATFDPASIYIKSVSAINGSGCQRGTYSVIMADDKKSFKIEYQNFELSTAMGENFKNCIFNISLSLPRDWRYAIVGVKNVYSADLSINAKGTIATQVYFQGNPTGLQKFETVITGPTNVSNKIWMNELKPEDISVWAPCNENRDLKLNTEIKAKSLDVNAYADITLNSQSANFSQQFKLYWEPCRT